MTSMGQSMRLALVAAMVFVYASGRHDIGCLTLQLS
jgi:hypothetical protein